MNFQEAIGKLKNVLKNTGTDIDVEKYDGLIIKQLASSNTLDEGRRTKQTHIAITGDQMDIFPYLCADGYFYDGNKIVNDDLKKYFIIRIQVMLHKSNCLYLNGELEATLHDEVYETSTCVVRSKRAAQTDQLQVSILNLDGKDFIAFRKLLHVGSYFVLLKEKNTMKYDLFGIKEDDGLGVLDEMNNNFYRSNTITTVDSSLFELEIEDHILAESKNTNGNSKAVNELYYGVPGAGKSWRIDQKIAGNKFERVVFHPDYTYTDFVGGIMPRLKKMEDGTEKLTYVFVPGPFTKAIKDAINNPSEMHYLVIEEINRGNAPAIFGDIFQLLDRDDDGASKYHITNFDIATEVYGNGDKPIKIPSNLSVLATMNTSDQNVFTLDTAFQRRWNMKYIENDVANAEHANVKLENSEVTWGAFASVVNKSLLEYASEMGNSEDKQLGAYFVKAGELTAELFPEKAIKYLWDDAFKMDHDCIFAEYIKSIGDIVDAYKQPGDPIKRIMKKEVYEKMMDMSAESVADAISEDETFSTVTAEENE